MTKQPWTRVQWYGLEMMIGCLGILIGVRHFFGWWGALIAASYGLLRGSVAAIRNYQSKQSAEELKERMRKSVGF